MNSNFRYFLSFSLFLLLIGNSCSVNRNTLTSRLYHNITAHYNAFFNGYESYKEGVKALETAHQDNYEKILPVFRMGDAQKAKSIYPQMDRAIEKASKVISKHAIKGKKETPKFWKKLWGKKKSTKKSKKKKKKLEDAELLMDEKKKEKKRNKYKKPEGAYAHWIDDSYMLLGKANFYKYEHFRALEAFEYVAKKYHNYPIKIDALMWMIRCYTEIGKYDEVLKVKDMIENSEYFPKNKKDDLAEVYADYYLKHEDYSSAIYELKNAIKYTHKRYLKARYSFILAQIYQKENNFSEASVWYERALKYHPPYEMEFRAKINQAMCYAGGESKKIKELLIKMSKDDKNKEYLDQIYFALADIAFKENQTEEAIEYLKLSTANSTTNTTQKALAYLKLADIYFEKNDYENAQAYYDSCVSFLSQDHKRYNEILNKKECLTALVKNLKIVALEDSLQKLANLPENQRNRIIDGIIQKIIDEEQKKKEEAEANKGQIYSQYEDPEKFNPAQSSGQWYFYNPTTLSIGYSEFIKRWGNRPLEDNWRRSNKSIIAMDFGTSEEESDTAKATLDELKSREYYLKKIPLTDSLMALSNNRIIEALFNLGIIYKDKLNDSPKAIESFKKLNERFPDNHHKITAYYYLYLIYKEIGNQQQAAYYKNLIIIRYPDSDYALLLQNSDYYAQTKKDDKVKVLYKNTYLLYQNNQFDEVIANCNQAEELYPKDKLIPKFHYLKALSIGKTKGISALKDELEKIIADYPQSEEKIKAQEMLAYLKKIDISSNLSGDIPTSHPQEIYSFNPDTLHYYIIWYNNKDIDLNKLKTDIANFNSHYFGPLDLKIQSIILDGKYNLVTVKSFPTMKDAMNYYETIIIDKTTSEYLNKDQFYHFVISPSNYAKFYSDKNIHAYGSFFEKNYKK